MLICWKYDDTFIEAHMIKYVKFSLLVKVKDANTPPQSSGPEPIRPSSITTTAPQHLQATPPSPMTPHMSPSVPCPSHILPKLSHSSQATDRGQGLNNAVQDASNFVSACIKIQNGTSTSSQRTQYPFLSLAFLVLSVPSSAFPSKFISIPSCS